MKKYYNLICLVISGIALTIIISGCATIFGWGGSENVNIHSNPDQANVTITDESGVKIIEGKTPMSIPLEKKKGYFSGKTYYLKISKEGYADKIITIDNKVNGWYIGGNLILGGLIGWLIVDPLTGAMWTLDSNEVNADLEAADQGTLMKSNEPRLILLENVPKSMFDKMIKIN